MGLCASTPAPPTEREPIAEETGVTKSDEPIVEPSDTEVAERIEAEKKHEKLTPVKLAAIGVVFVFFVWMTIESIYEVIRSLGGFGDPAEVPMSALRRAAFGNTNEISSEVCLQTNYGGGCPLFKPMGECSPFSERFIGHRVHSLVIGHMVTSPHLTAKVIIDLIHVFGACSSYTLLFATVVLGGPAYYGGFKKLVMNNLTFLPWQMVISGSLLAGLRVSTDEGFPAINLYPSESWQSVTYGQYSPWHEISRAGFLVAFAFGFVNSGMAEATIFKVYPAKYIFVMHLLSCLGWSVTLTTEVVQMFTLPLQDFRWTVNFYDAFITSVYPMLDLPFLYALYWGWYKGKQWDWDAHREFGLSSYALQTIFAIVYFMTCDKGIVFSSTVPVSWRIFFNFLVIGPWAVMYYVPFLIKCSKLGSKTPDATRAPEDWWTVDGKKVTE
mmetsp:Transcript_20457/g.52862  ORF Transcript_20457/g.52862 Transcript_20457/m.52862 type:complete len:440 (+) Transcript_20457:64-1383(+)|eukprot:CAMPEP_0119405542 /NCGR_PEP_ID=MMETSP1335-20130426/76_1 /TAXON_ID=259385 /ORGANISM="Chrysoculter rhomboideus, Strain RCC1486" /LENGTH=439 /DNA_ID=CAMNT_0007429537 /DNA_START=50 /DNA_END=1369 /DNA_ORIENTATION=+